MSLAAKIVPRLPVLDDADGVHAKHCRNCPSQNGSSDPECDDILKMPLQDRARSCFPCGWNGAKLCRGYVTLMGVTDKQAMDGYLEARNLP